MSKQVSQQAKGVSAQSDLARRQSAAQNALGDPSLYPDEFKSWIARWLFGNVNFSVTSGQLPEVEAAHAVGGTNQIAFAGTWVNFGGSNEVARYWRDYTGIVHLGGIVKLGVIGTTIFTLPAGYRPQYAMIYAVASNGAFGIVTVNPDGTVVASAGNNTYVSLSGINFRQYQ